MIYLIITIITIIGIITYLLIRLLKNTNSSTNNRVSILKSGSSSTSNDGNIKYNLYDNILSVNTIPVTSRYDYMSSNNLLSESYNNAWFPTERLDKKYTVIFDFKKRVIIRKINIYTGLSNANNKYTNLFIKDEIGNIVLSRAAGFIDKDFSISSYDEINLPNDLDTTKITFEFTAKLDEFIVRKIDFFGIVSMKSNLEKLTGKHVYPTPSSNYQDLLVKINKTPQEISDISSLVGNNYNSQNKQLRLHYNFSKIYSIYAVEIVQKISNLSSYGYSTVNISSMNGIKSEPFDSTKLFKIFNSDASSTNSFINTSVLDSSIDYTYTIYFDNIMDNNLMLTFNDVNNINDLNLIQVKFYAYEVVFGYFDNILISKNNWRPYDNDFLSISEIELLNQDFQNILPSSIFNGEAEISQFPNDRDLSVKKIVISNRSSIEYNYWPNYMIDTLEKFNGYLSNEDNKLISPVSRQGSYVYLSSGKPEYVLDIRNINIYDDKNILINQDSYDSNATSVFKIKMQNEANFRIYSVISPSTNIKGMGLGYISSPIDKDPKITIIFKVPIKLKYIDFNLGSSVSKGGCRVQIFNEYNEIISDDTIRPLTNTPRDNFGTRLTTLTPTYIYPIDDNGSVYNAVDYLSNTSSKTYPGFAIWKNINPTSTNILGPYIYIKFNNPVLLSGIRLRNSQSNIVGTSIFASLSEGRSKMLLDTKTSFSCIKDGNLPYIAYRVNENGKSECLSKDGIECIKSDTLEYCNREIMIKSNNYNNKECGINDNNSNDCLYYQKNKININTCIQDENGNYNKFYYRYNTNTQRFEISCESSNNNCRTFTTYDECNNFNNSISQKICSNTERNKPDTLCGLANYKLVSNLYNNVYKSFDVQNESEFNNYYFPLGIALTEKSIVTLKDNMLLCLDEYNTSNNATNNIKLKNCNSNYSQIFRNKKYFNNTDDAIGTNKIYIPNIDKCLTYFENKLTFKNCDSNLNYIQEFNINQNGNLYYPASSSCLNINNNEDKDGILSPCSNSAKFQFLNLNNTECSSFNCENSIVFSNNNVRHLLLLDTDGMLKLLKINNITRNIEQVIDLVNTKPDKFKKINNLHTYPYNMKITSDGELVCYDKNDKIVWITFKNNSLINPPYKLTHTYNGDNITIHIVNKLENIITSF